MGVLIDTSIFVEVERCRLDLNDYLGTRADDAVFLSVVTVSELLHGLHRARDAAIRSRRSTLIQSIIAGFRHLPIGLAVARAHARLWADLDSAGTPVGAHDIWLAATCLVHDLTIVTTNARDFRRVPGLKMDPWPAKSQKAPE